MKKVELDPQSQVQSVLELLPLFDVYVETYKIVNDHPIDLHILVPMEKRASKRPLLVKLHGGAWHEGSSESSFRPWTVEFAIKHNAVIVTPDYRLLPEGQFPDMIEDLRDFWLWVENDLEKLPGIDVNAKDLAIFGESAGGYLTAQSVLLGFTKQASVILLQYPALSIKKHLDWNRGGPAVDRDAAASVVDDYLAKVGPHAVLTRAEFGTRMDLARASMRSCRLVDLVQYPHLDPITSLETAERIPPVFLFHGVDDTSVAIDDSHEWVEKLKRLHPKVHIHTVWLNTDQHPVDDSEEWVERLERLHTRVLVHTDYPPGEHVVDKYHRLDEPWLREPIAFVEQYWPLG